MCDCLNEEESSPKSTSSSQTSTDKQDLPPQFTVLQVEISKSLLDLASSSDSLSTEISNAQNSQEGVIQYIICPAEENRKAKEEEEDKEESLRSCSCTEPCETEDDSLKSCTCTEPCDSESTNSQFTEPSKTLECTLAIIKPEAMIFRNEIEREILDEGFSICQSRWLQLTPEQVSDFYLDQYERENFARLVAYMSSDSILVFILSKIDAVNQWLLTIGPTKVSEAKVYVPDSIRGKYGRMGDDLKNVVHGSTTCKDAEREIHFFFPNYVVEKPFSKRVAIDYLQRELREILQEGLVKCCEEKPDDPVTWLGNWLLDNNPKKPKYLLRYKSNLYD